MKFSYFSLFLAFFLVALPLWMRPAVAQEPVGDPALTVNTGEAEAVLAILATRQQGATPTEDQWKALFATEGYRRLQEREVAMKLSFDEATFKDFALSADLLNQASALRETLERWRLLDFQAAARKVSVYLPAGARIRATVFFVIKPKPNDFVFDLSGSPSVFFHLDPAVDAAKLENTIAHELHHIGLHGRINEEGPWKGPEKGPRSDARRYVGAFGEGFAMLAAAGGPDIHPHAVSPAAQRARWDKDWARYAEDLRQVDAFLLDVAVGRLGPQEARKKAIATFWGDAQGAWYTVGYGMAVLIERTFGRDRLLKCMTDLSLLLPTYNEAARLHNQGAENPLPLWSDALLKALDGSSAPPDQGAEAD